MPEGGLQRLKDAYVRSNFRKYKFINDKMFYLGHHSETGPAEGTSNPILSPPRLCKIPKNISGIGRLLQPVCKAVTQRAQLLSEITWKNATMVYDTQRLNAFKDFRSVLLSELVLHYPDFQNKFLVKTDTNGTTFGGIFTQEYLNGKTQWGTLPVSCLKPSRIIQKLR